MITAEEARKTAQNPHSMLLERETKAVENAIRIAAVNGQYSAVYDFSDFAVVCVKDICDLLRKNGYTATFERVHMINYRDPYMMYNRLSVGWGNATV